jgi:RsiW-degrading membrane proteinase PrsW (M82 family)
MSIQRSILNYLAFVLAIALPPFALINTGNNDLVTPRFWLIFFFISALTFMVLITILFVQQKNKELYAQAFLAGTTLKFLACLFFIVIFLRKNQVDKLVFVGDFFYVYFLNTAFEVYGLLRNLRNQNLR